MSKTIVALAGIIVLSTGIQGLWSAPQQDNPAVLLRAAIEKEEVDGDLNAAIEQYKQVIKLAGADRAVAAQALLRLGGCYEKRGPEEARRAYQQLVRDYADQVKEAAAARQRLAALAVGPPARAGGSGLSIRRVPDLDMFAKPSPDGKYVAFTDWKSGNLAILDVATGATKALTKDASFGDTGGYAEFSAWSRDSRRIAYQWDAVKENRTELRVLSVEADAPPETISIPDARWVEPLDWSPDGSRILCSYDQPARRGSALALVSVNGHAIEKLDMPSGGWFYEFTPDGGAILYSGAADGKAGPSDIFLRHLKTGTTAPVVQHPGEDLLVGVLPGSDWLLFASDRRGRLDMWAIPFRDHKAHGDPVLVKQGLGRFYPLGFSNDGRYYYATLSATDDVYFADFDRESGRVTGEARKLKSRWDGVNSFPSFSPDGGSLAFAAKRGPNPIPVHGTDSLVIQPLKEPVGEPVVVGFDEFGLTQVMGPCWQADGKAVVLGGYGGPGREEHALYRVELPGLKATRIYSLPEGCRLNGHVCAGDGPYIYVAVTVPAAAGQTTQRSGFVVRIDAAGGQEREVLRTPSGQGLSGISLSPDGKALSIVTSLDRQRRALSVMPSQGGTLRQIVEFRQPSGGGVYSVWAPDGRSILYIQMSDTWKDDHTFFLRSVRVDGGAAVPETIFRWPGQFFWLKFHPNGRLLAFTGRPDVSTSSEVWVMENLREEMKLLAAPGKRP